jgi:hypothetical protein
MDETRHNTNEEMKAAVGQLYLLANLFPGLRFRASMADRDEFLEIRAHSPKKPQPLPAFRTRRKS